MPSTVQNVLYHTFDEIDHWKNRQQYLRLRKSTGKYSLAGFDDLRCIYVHIPKAAGISINKALFGNYGGGHKTVRSYRKIFGTKTYKSYFKFTFVRNPYSRLLSAYHFLKDGGFHEKDKKWAMENLSAYNNFNTFVEEWINEENIWKYIHFKPQYFFVTDMNLELDIDFVGKTENIESDFKLICWELNLENKLTIQNKGNKDHTDWINQYSEISLQKIARIYHQDFKLFRYQQF